MMGCKLLQFLSLSICITIEEIEEIEEIGGWKAGSIIFSLHTASVKQNCGKSGAPPLLYSKVPGGSTGGGTPRLSIYMPTLPTAVCCYRLLVYHCIVLCRLNVRLTS